MWLPVAGGYEVCHRGRVRNARTRRLLSQWRTPSGYMHVTLRVDGQQVNRRVHRLVADAFLADWDPALTVDHLNRDRADNRLHNLRMATHVEQCVALCRANNARGLRVPVRRSRGSAVVEYGSITEAARAGGFGTGRICQALKTRKTAYGYEWAYVCAPDLPGEEWRQFSPHVRVSNMGRYSRRRQAEAEWTSPKDASQMTLKGGYPSFKTCGKDVALHRAVAAAFLDPPAPHRTVVNHMDGNTRNAAAANLEWATQSENMRHYIINKNNTNPSSR